MAVSMAALERLPAPGDLSKLQAKRLRDNFDRHVTNLTRFRERIDPVADPDASFDPSNPDTVGRLVVIALMAQERVPLAEIRPTYGSGVYAIYYNGAHPAYAEISRTETPIYVGKADPEEPMAATPRAQGVRLFGRLADHRTAIRDIEVYAHQNELPHPLQVADFECRRLVCATNAQLVAERHLIDIFKPAWNAETKICFGISKHGDNAYTRRNKKSPWDVLHPGRAWAAESDVRSGMSPDTIMSDLNGHFSRQVPYRAVDDIMEIMLDKFRQVGRASQQISAAASESDEVEATRALEAAQREFDLDSEGTRPHPSD